MDVLIQLMELDFKTWFIGLVLLVTCIKSVCTLFDWLLFEKLGIETRRMRQRRQNGELLKATAELAQETAKTLEEFQKKNAEDNKKLRDDLNTYIQESREDRKALHNEMTKFTENRANDRKQSLEVQKELKDSASERDARTDALMIGMKEILAEKINEKYKHYISIGGIPEDEYDEFVNMHKAYNGVGGNSHGDAKFEYCMEHLPIIPVETKLVHKHE